MITTGALLSGDAKRWLAYNGEEHPLALQLGGSDAADLARCAELAQEWGYDEVNLNCGCPSDRVQSGRFGACLMAEPELVAECVAAMKAVVDIPVTVKHRIGIDDQDEYADLSRFVATVAAAGCEVFIVHARKAWLQGLSPKQNRDIPPLNYERAAQLKTEFPQLTFVLNGGLQTLAQCQEQLQRFEGVMVGRELYSNPFLLTEVEAELFDNPQALSRHEVLGQYHRYCEEQLSRGTPLPFLTKPAMGLFHAQPGGKQFRRYLSDNVRSSSKDGSVLLRAADAMSRGNN